MKSEHMNEIINSIRDTQYRNYNNYCNIDDVCEFVFIKFFLPLLDYSTMNVRYENNNAFIDAGDIGAVGLEYRTWIPFSIMSIRLKNTLDGGLREAGALAMNIVNLNRIGELTRARVFNDICEQLKLYFHVRSNQSEHWDDMLHVIRVSAYAGAFDLLKFLDILVQDEEVAGSIVVSIEQMIHEFMPGQNPIEKLKL